MRQTIGRAANNTAARGLARRQERIGTRSEAGVMPGYAPEGGATGDGASDGASAPRALPGWRRALLRQGVVLVLLIGLVVVARERIAALDVAAIKAALATVSVLQWALALGATALSFAALARYDALVHRMIGTGIAPAPARRAGWSAIALSQVLGFGLVSGALVRWRMLPGLSLVEASKVTAAVAASFLAAWAVLAAGALLVAPVALRGLPAATVQGLAGLALATGGALALLALARPSLRIGPLGLRLPAPPVMAQILGLAALDTAFAALALWALLPAGSVVPLAALYPAFLLALGAGFVSGTPGGVGPFEMVLLLLLPGLDQAPLLAAVLAWRVAYYGLPAALAVALVLGARPRAARIALPAPRPLRAAFLAPDVPLPTPVLWALDAAREAGHPAEIGLHAQGEHGLLFDPGTGAGWLIGRAPGLMAALLDPFGPARATPGLIATLGARARAEHRTPCLYKIGARSAALARTAGWQVAPVGRELWLDLDDFTLDTPTRAGLRRKLRKAAKVGVTVAALPPDALPLAELARLNTDWSTARGGERGFSMGRFAPAYLTTQRVFAAQHAGQIVGFASFHAAGPEWVLDLMRPGPAAPDGTMQALILAALEAARAEGAARLSLAALPPDPDHLRGPAARLWRFAGRNAGARGLAQFKDGFAPRSRTLYLATPGRAGLALAALRLARAIHRPAALPPAPSVSVAPDLTTSTPATPLAETLRRAA